MSATIFPSQGAWITPRTNDGKIDTTNCEILLNQRIDEINKLLLNTSQVKISQIYGSKGERLSKVLLSELYLDDQYSISLSTLDITKYVVEKARYDTLTFYGALDPIPWGKVTLNNAWYYEHNGMSIILLNSRQNIFSGYILPNIIQASLFDVAIMNHGSIYYKNSGAQKFTAKITTQNIMDIHSDSIVADLLTIQFRVYYTPFGESVKLDALKTNPQPTKFCIPYGQQQPIVDNVSHGREMQSIANRTGCETRELVRTFVGAKHYRSPHDHWFFREKDANGKETGNVWRLTTSTLSVIGWDDKEKCHIYRSSEVWSKNWSYRSSNVPINREFRSWNIPADIVQRNMRWQDYCLITRKNIDLPDTCLLSDWAKRKLLSLQYVSGDDINSECNNMWYYRVNEKGEKHGVALSCSAFGFGYSLVFSGKTKDNLSAGVQRVKSDDKDNNYQFCKDVYYCDDNGEVEDMYIQVGSMLDVASHEDVKTDSMYMYPEFKTVVNDRGGTAKFIPYNAPKEGYNLFKEDVLFHILKDPCEQLNFTYQLHLLTDDGRLVIGSTWAASNPLVKQDDINRKLKTWRLTQYLPQGAQVMTTNYGLEYSNYFTFNRSNNTVTFPAIEDDRYVGWCVTDEYNNVLLAYNGRDEATFTLKYTHDYTAMARALKK